MLIIKSIQCTRVNYRTHTHIEKSIRSGPRRRKCKFKSSFTMPPEFIINRYIIFIPIFLSTGCILKMICSFFTCAQMLNASGRVCSRYFYCSPPYLTSESICVHIDLNDLMQSKANMRAHFAHESTAFRIEWVSMVF